MDLCQGQFFLIYLKYLFIFILKYLNDLFLVLSEIDFSNFANGILWYTAFVCHKNRTELLEKLERNSALAIH